MNQQQEYRPSQQAKEKWPAQQHYQHHHSHPPPPQAASGPAMSQRPGNPRRVSDLSNVYTVDLQSNIGDVYPELAHNKHHELLGKLDNPEFQAQIRAYCTQHSPEALAELDKYLATQQRQQPAATAAVPNNQDQMVKEIVDDYQMLQMATEKYKQAGEAYHFWEAELLRIQARMEMRKGLADVGSHPSYRDKRNSQGQ
ncbi:uncharacterized protein NECHADRAFT_88803 [Fusarium vanettenii 77-13-4]|uniref:Uncharacterized protein n=1 Tax=Fusarium vanettenii (strain ATCC MYA-4622 / CBS 123669 / FGSC 9596 / NRRL 45880 / 77-13-4) TaxID=660122 RepID=C7ZKG5_FUSV7|nr:uncharacterized protein NECHADRAFT_88803 [Fusarium vanettenii 77-13-4]EEU35559.1 predicted protein [Fusarium vanettenii 77-13-4]